MKLVVGRVGRAHGVRGDVAIDVRTDDPDIRFAKGARLDTESGRSLTIATRKYHAGRLIVRFSGISDRTAAEELRGLTLVVDATEALGSADPDEFHDAELLGLAVVTAAGQEVGTVADVLHHSQDLLVIDTPTGDEVLVPFVRDIVPTVDPVRGRLVVDPPPGLLEL
ncbi:ribosome maturation factor RimM [Spiractinospora alimapuensis]|uniref:ribosome maturation factor RimM n=1 Tax=Spiractinospora alimapuensis TaxID=2820884 RepID=UPI001EEA7D46|nr:ribosome maturation factor RimM [Spiractinospora alimapuensis]QVQ51676.1 ribosome maturation factor RimM [Spiractinospora alimapuensis]